MSAREFRSDLGDEPSDPDWSVASLVELVVERFPSALTGAQFEATVAPALIELDAIVDVEFGPPGYGVRRAVLHALSDRLRMSMLGDVLARSAILRPDRDPAGCRCCGFPFERLRFVDEDGICPACWDFPCVDRSGDCCRCCGQEFDEDNGICPDCRGCPPLDRPSDLQDTQDDALRRQLLMIVGSAPSSSRLEIRWRNARGRMRQQWVGVGEIERAGRAIRNVQQIGDVFVGVAPRVRDGGTAKDVEQTNCLWVDLDSPEALDGLRDFRPGPTMVIETGSGGGHGYWQLSEPLPADWAQRANRRLARVLGGDRASTDPARILRPAGSLNWKHEPPRPVRCVMYSPRVYPVVEIVGGLPDDDCYTRRPIGRAPGDTASRHHGASLDGLVRVVRAAEPGERNCCLFWSACRAAEDVRYGRMDAALAEAELRHAALATGLPDVEIDRTIRSAFETGMAA